MFLEDGTPHDLKYIQELSDDLTHYVSQLIFNVYNGVSKNIGVANPDTLATKSPYKLQKGFLSGMKGLGKKLKGYFGRNNSKSPYEPFKIKGLKLYHKGEAMSMEDWHKFENQVTNYLRPYTNSLAEEMAVKGILLSMASLEAEQQGKQIKQYGKKGLAQIEKDLFSGAMPSSIKSTDDRYKLDPYAKQARDLSQIRVADYLVKVEDDLRTAIKQQVISAQRQGLSAQELASDLYWMKEDKPEMKKYTAQINMKNWHRVANTELAMIHESGKLAAYENQAKESIKKPEKAVYMVFGGSGRCDWCNAHLGTITRLIPIELVGNPADDSLSSRGIKDDITDICVWSGKSNIGFNKAQWRVCAPIHPWCGDSLSPINPETHEYDKKLKIITLKKDETLEKFIPKDFLKELEEKKALYRERQDILEKERMKDFIVEEKT